MERRCEKRRETRGDGAWGGGEGVPLPCSTTHARPSGSLKPVQVRTLRPLSIRASLWLSQGPFSSPLGPQPSHLRWLLLPPLPAGLLPLSVIVSFFFF